MSTNRPRPTRPASTRPATARSATARFRRHRIVAALCAVLLTGACTVGGAAVKAPYRSRPVDALASRPIPAAAGALALSPDGTLAAVADAQHGVCFRPVRASGAAPLCAAVRIRAGAVVTAAFSPDGRLVALGADVAAQSRGSVWVVDVRTGRARSVPALPGRPAAPSSRSAGPSTAAPATADSPTYVGLLWAPGGDLLLISSSVQADGAHTRLVDVDPTSLVPRVVAEATGPYEFQSGYVVAGGPVVVLTVFRGDQLTPNVVVLDLDTGIRREFSPVTGDRLVPLAVSPDGRTAVVGVSTLAHPGPPRLLDLASGVLTPIPGLSGDFAVAAFSPDGTRIAVVDSIDGPGLLVAVAAVPGGRARTVSRDPGRLAARSAMSWSVFDVLSVSAPRADATAVGWSLAG